MSEISFKQAENIACRSFLEKKLSYGSQGETYLTKIKSPKYPDQMLVAKVTKSWHVGQLEVDAQRYANQRGIGPRIYKAWKCNNSYITLMDAMKEDMGDVWRRQGRRFTKADLAAMLGVARKLDRKRIAHGDLAARNIMYDNEGKAHAVDFGEMVAYEATRIVDFGSTPWRRMVIRGIDVWFPSQWVPGMNVAQLAITLGYEYGVKLNDLAMTPKEMEVTRGLLTMERFGKVEEMRFYKHNYRLTRHTKIKIVREMINMSHPNKQYYFVRTPIGSAWVRRIDLPKNIARRLPF